MKLSLPVSIVVALLLTVGSDQFCEARRSSNSRSAVSRSSGRTSSGGRRSSSRRRDVEEYDSESPLGGVSVDEEDTYDDVHGEYDDEEAYDDEYDAVESSSRSRRGGRSSSKSRSRSSKSYDDPYDEEDDYSPSSSSRRSSRRSSRGSSNKRGSSNRGGMVRYSSRGPPRPPPPSAFTRGLSALRSAIPDPATVRDAALSAAAAAKESTSRLSSNLYREVKGLTSSELEQVMLKSTKPDDSPVKGKHVERLVGVTYQISGRYDIYDAVLRKLWAKMTENDWRTTIKALYILHRFSADGAPDHQASLKAHLRELRRTVDPKRKDKYFNSKQLLGGDTNVRNPSYCKNQLFYFFQLTIYCIHQTIHSHFHEKTQNLNLIHFVLFVSSTFICLFIFINKILIQNWM